MHGKGKATMLELSNSLGQFHMQTLHPLQLVEIPQISEICALHGINVFRFSVSTAVPSLSFHYFQTQ